MLIKGKKGAEPATIAIILVILIAGFFVAKQTGLFAVFTPPQPDSALNSIVNKYYYDATNQPPVACQQLVTVIFRTDLSFSTTSAPGTGSQIAVSEGGTELVGARATGSSLSGQSGTCESAAGLGTLKISTGNLRVYKASAGEYNVCVQQTPTTHARRAFTSNTVGITIPLSTTPGAGAGTSFTNELTQTTQIKDAGIYACVGGNVVTQYCGAFGSTSSGTRPNGDQNGENCALGCEFIANYNIGNNVLVNTVKCAGTYQPNKNMCGTDVQAQTGLPRTLYQTNAAGTLAVTTCGFACNSGTCVDCKEGTRQCATNTLIQVCSNGRWTNDVLCSGLSSCSQTGSWPNTAASCVSNFLDGEERCAGNQPQVFRTSTNSWQNKSYACTTQCQKTGNTADCVDQCTGNSCEAGALFTCNLADSGNTKVQAATCVSGQCNTNGLTCKPKYEINKLYCKNGDVYKAIPDSSNPANGGTTLGSSPQVDCKLTCQELTPGQAECTKLPECVGSEGSNVCIAGQTSQIGTCNSVGDQITNVQDCKTLLSNDRATCSVTNNVAACIVPSTECAGNFACKNGQMYTCANGYWGTPINTCNNLGCELSGTGLPSSTNSQCKNSPEYSGNLNSCISSSSVNFQVKNVTDADGVQYIKGTTLTCGSDGCDLNTGLCKSQCSPGENVCVGDAVYVCDSSGTRPSTAQYTCNTLGCNSDGKTCNTEPSSIEGQYKCKITSGTKRDSYIGIRNSTSNQYYYKISQSCGADGCNEATGKCFTVGNPDSYVCLESNVNTGLGGKIYRTDANSQKIIPAIADCSASQDINGLKAFCVDGVDKCQYCVQNHYYCGAKERFVCSDPATGAKSNVEVCSAGCFPAGTNGLTSTLCDNLNLIFAEKQNFRPNEVVLVKAQLKGSQTGFGVKTQYSATITGGVTQTKTGLSDDDGFISVDFGTQTLGTYNVEITFPEHPGKSITIQSKVTDDYKIKLSSSEAILMIPGVQTKFSIITEGNGVPDNIIKSNVPTNLTVDIVGTGVSGKWDVIIIGQPGVYNIGLKAVKSGVEQEEQTIVVDLRRPTLRAKTNLEQTGRPGIKDFDVELTGPISATSSANIIPDTVKAYIAHSPAEEITLNNLGGGRYTTSYDFSEIGVYTLTVEATKSGYEFQPFSYVVTISQDGTSSAPGSSSNSGGTGGGSSTGGGTTGGDTGGFDSKTIIIIVVVAGIVWYFTKKK